MFEWLWVEKWLDEKNKPVDDRRVMEEWLKNEWMRSRRMSNK